MYHSFVSDAQNISQVTPNIQALVLEKCLISKWSDYISILKACPLLETLNLSDNRMHFDDAFTGEIEHASLNTLILNKCNLRIEDLKRISPTMKGVKKLYLFGNKCNTAEAVLENSLSSLEHLSLEANEIQDINAVFKALGSPKLKSLNINRNEVQRLSLGEASSSLEQLLIDYNNLDSAVIGDLQPFSSLKEVHIVHNQFWAKEKSKIELVGRLGALKYINNTFITRDDRRDYDILYLKDIVVQYFKANEKFDREAFDNFAKEKHPRYFSLKKSYFDPVEDHLNSNSGGEKKTIKSTIKTFRFVKGEESLSKKLPKTITFSNLRNVLCRLFKCDSNFTFTIENGEFPLKVDDETQSLEFYNVREEDQIRLEC